MPILTLISNSGRVLLADGIQDLQDSMDQTDSEDIKEQWVAMLN